MEENQEVVQEQIVEQPETEVTDGVQEEGQETTEEVKPEKPKEEPLPKGVQKRIDRAVRQKYEAEAEARVLRERLAQFEQRQQATQTREPGEPKLDQFDNIEEYVAAKAAWVTDRKIKETLESYEKTAAERNAKAAQEKTAETWQKRVATAQADLPDYDDVVGSSDIVFKEPAVLAAIQESDIGPKIAYYLASNPDEAEDIAELRGIAAIRAIGRIEAKLEAQKSSVTKTPAPIKPVGQKSNIEKSPEKMTDAEFAAWRKKQIAARNGR